MCELRLLGLLPSMAESRLLNDRRALDLMEWKENLWSPSELAGEAGTVKVGLAATSGTLDSAVFSGEGCRPFPSSVHSMTLSFVYFGFRFSRGISSQCFVMARRGLR